MRAGLIVGGVLGLGTALTFGAAIAVASLFPGGTLVPAGANWGNCMAMAKNGMMVDCVAPAMRIGGPVMAGGGSTSVTVVAGQAETSAPADGSSPESPPIAPDATPGG